MVESVWNIEGKGGGSHFGAAGEKDNAGNKNAEAKRDSFEYQTIPDVEGKTGQRWQGRGRSRTGKKIRCYFFSK